jgi:predicted permease
MKVAIGILLACAMVITLGASLLTNVKLWGLARESRRSFRQLPADRRRSVLRRLAAMYAVGFAECAVVLIAPFGVRETLVYFVILPFVVLVPLGLLAVGIRGFRGQRRRGPPSA